MLVKVLNATQLHDFKVVVEVDGVKHSVVVEQVETTRDAAIEAERFIKEGLKK